MPHNPFGNPLFLPSLGRVLALIVLGVAGVMLAQRRPLRVLRRSTFFSRARTWLWLGPLFLVCAFTQGFVAFGLAAYVTIHGLSEFVRLAGVQRRYALLLVVGSLLGLLVAALARSYFLFLPFAFFILLTLVPIVGGDVEGSGRQVGDTLFGYLYIGLPLAYIVFVKAAEPWGLNFIVLVTVAVAVSDIAAYAVGVALKGPKLIPRVDPDKTWSGALGNLLGAAVGVGLLWNVVPHARWDPAAVVVLVVMIGVGSMWGDVTEAFVKRAFRVEAASTFLVGFGGVLDRVDSLLMAFPLAYYAVRLTLQLTT